MSSERLLKHFDKIVNTPDAIPRLRRFILDLAVRGKLVPQDPEDEPASKLLKRIEAEKVRLVKAAALRNQSTHPIDKEQIIFNIPTNWSWTQLSQIGVINPRNESTDSADASFVPMPMIFAEYGKAHQHEVRTWGENKKGFTHFAEGDVGLAKITPCFENGKSTVFRNLTGGLGAGTTELHIVRPIYVVPDYILIFLKSSHFIETGIPKMTGTAGQKRVSKDYFAFSPFPLPPLAEQHRIVAKVDELMALCDELEKAQEKREARRDCLVAATLAGLTTEQTEQAENIPSMSSAYSAVPFFLKHMPRLTTRPEHIKQLRQTILNLAVRGKLISQDANISSTDDLLKSIQVNKLRLEQEGKFRKQRFNPVIDKNKITFEIPERWKWVQLGDISILIGGYAYESASYVKLSHNQVIRLGNIKNDNLLLNQKPVYIPDSVANNTLDFLILPGDILITMTGTKAKRDYAFTTVVRETDLTERRLFLNQRAGAIRPYQRELVPLINIFLKAESLLDILFATSTGTANQANIGSEAVLNLPIPLPPLAEQHRIVAKIKELMALCDELETQFTSTTATRRQLLETTIYDALNKQYELQ